MTINVQNTALTNTFDFWRTRTNEIANALATKVLTVDSNTTVGNASINGHIFIGNSSINAIVNSTSLVIGSNIVVNTTAFFTGNSTVNGYITPTGLYFNGVASIQSFSLNVQTSGTSAQLTDSFTQATYRSAEYFVNIKNNSANAVQMAKVSVIHDGGTSYLTEYAIVYSNTNLGEFSANCNTTHVRVYFTPTVTNTQIKAIKTLIVV